METRTNHSFHAGRSESEYRNPDGELREPEEYSRPASEEAPPSDPFKMPKDTQEPAEFPDFDKPKKDSRKKRRRQGLLSRSAGLVAAVAVTVAVLVQSDSLSYPFFQKQDSPHSRSEETEYTDPSRDLLAFCNRRDSVELFNSIYDMMAAEQFDEMFAFLWSIPDYWDDFFDTIPSRHGVCIEFTGDSFTKRGEKTAPLLRVFADHLGTADGLSNDLRSISFETVPTAFPDRVRFFDFSQNDSYLSYSIAGDFLSQLDADNVIMNEYLAHTPNLHEDVRRSDERYLSLEYVYTGTVRNGNFCGDLTMRHHPYSLDERRTEYQEIIFHLVLDSEGVIDLSQMRCADAAEDEDALSRFIAGDVDVLIDRGITQRVEDLRARYPEIDFCTTFSIGSDTPLGAFCIRGESWAETVYAIGLDWAYSGEEDVSPYPWRSVSYFKPYR